MWAWPLGRWAGELWAGCPGVVGLGLSGAGFGAEYWPPGAAPEKWPAMDCISTAPCSIAHFFHAKSSVVMQKVLLRNLQATWRTRLIIERLKQQPDGVSTIAAQ